MNKPLSISLALLAAFAARADWFGFGSSEPPLDLNGDGRVRIALVSLPVHPGGMSAANICADLESIVRQVTSKPVRVVLVPVAPSKTLYGWWYSPKSRADRSELLAGAFDHVLLAESEDIVRQYPEIFFEGVRALSEALRARGSTPDLLMLARPGNSFREHRIAALADIVYRVGDGCSVRVIPAATAWPEALRHNRMPPETPLRARANDCLAAQTAYYEISGEEPPAADTDWTVRKTVSLLAQSASEAADRARKTKQYFGPFTGGTVRILPHPAYRLAIYTTATQQDDPVRANLDYILRTAFQSHLIKTPADWYADGFDRNSIPLDCFYGDTRQADAYLDPDAYTSQPAPVSSAQTLLAVYSPLSAPDPEAYLETLEQTTLDGYAYAREKGFTYIPYPVAWARLNALHPECTKPPVPGKTSDWLTYMLANMLYTSLTGRYQPAPEKDLPRIASDSHPYGYHALAARVGYETVRQLSTLGTASSAIILQTLSSRVAPSAPAFARIRLLNRPAAEVAVHIAVDPPAATLSLPELRFTPENFDIDQTVRIQSATNSPLPALVSLMAAAQSADPAIDGSYDKRLYLVNVPDDPAPALRFSTTAVSPKTGYRPTVTLADRPLDILSATVTQHNVPTETVYFTPDAYTSRPFTLYPTAADYAAGSLSAAFTLRTADGRAAGKPVSMRFALSAGGLPLPALAIASPAPRAKITGPAFVRAETRSEPAPADLSLFLGPKRLGHAAAPTLSAAVETSAPPSRLPPGDYTLWASALTPAGLLLATEPVPFTVTPEKQP